MGTTSCTKRARENPYKRDPTLQMKVSDVREQYVSLPCSLYKILLS